MTRPPRVAFFTDSYDETNGVARLSHEFEAYAARRDLPLLCVHGGGQTAVGPPGPRQRLQLRRSAAAFRIEHDLSFDPLLWRHASLARQVVADFRPDVLHITGPSDVGQLGAWLGHRLHIPIVGSWHTNLHEYAALRSLRWVQGLPASWQRALRDGIERQTLRAALLFYRIPRVLLAPNAELVSLLSARTDRPTGLMRHGVDTVLFTPDKRTRARPGVPVRIGFVGRLSAEKHVRLLADLDRALARTGVPYAFEIVGDGAERDWLERHLTTVRSHGVLTGDALARVYADMDVFVFPSASETFGLVTLEAMASGVPVVAMAHGGPKFVVETDATGWLAADDDAFVSATLRLVGDPARRERLGRGARLRARDWSWDSVFDDVYTVYSEALDDARPAPSAVPA